MVKFEGNLELAGFIPQFLNEEDPDDAVTQLDKHYTHGGGWRDFEGFKLYEKDGKYHMKYPGDPAYVEQARGKMRDETVLIFRHGWVCVVQPDESYRVCRMD